MKYLFPALLLLALASLAGCHHEMAKPPADEQVMCTMDAKLCPDGSAVGRVGPHCEFAPCPGK